MLNLRRPTVDKETLLLHAQTAWTWWLTGMLHLMPPSWRSRWFPPREILEVRRDGESLQLTHRSSGNMVLNTQRVPFTPLLPPTDVSTWLATQVPLSARVICSVPEARVLSRTLRLPLAVEPDLRSLVELELDRWTPFTPNDVYFDVAVATRDLAARVLTCRFALIKRQDVDPILDALRSLGRPIQAIHTDPPFEIALNLLPPALRPKGDLRARQRTVLVVGAAVALFLATLYVPLLRHESLLSDWQRQVAVQRDAASAAQNLLTQKTALEQRAQFVAERRAQRRALIETLKELTERLPDAAWVNRLMAQGEDVQLFGEAESATALVPLLESSDRFQQVEFRSPTTRNDTTDKDRFHIGLHQTSNVPSK